MPISNDHSLRARNYVQANLRKSISIGILYVACFPVTIPLTCLAITLALILAIAWGVEGITEIMKKSPQLIIGPLVMLWGMSFTILGTVIGLLPFDKARNFCSDVSLGFGAVRGGVKTCSVLNYLSFLGTILLVYGASSTMQRRPIKRSTTSSRKKPASAAP